MTIGRAPVSGGGAGNAAVVTVSGSPTLGSTLTASISGGYIASFQWTRDGVDIPGATSNTYTIVGADTNKTIRARTTELVLVSDAIAVGATAPSWTAAPVILGTPTFGVVTSYLSGTYTGSTPITVTRQWLLNGTAIPGATGATYTPQLTDVGATLAIRETATNVAGSVFSDSAGVAVANSSSNSLQLEDGTDLLLEDGTSILLET